MKHSFFDKYSYLNTPVHKIPPVVKIVSFLVLDILILTVSEKSILVYPIAVVFISFLLYLSKIPVSFVLKKVVVVIPFVLLIALCKFFSKSISYTVIIRTILNSSIIIVLLILLVETTKFVDLLKSLSKIGTPKIIVILLSFIYRYFFILIDEIEKMMYSVKLRSYKNISLTTLASIVGILFIRSYERAERIYSAMVMRGFNGEIK